LGAGGRARLRTRGALSGVAAGPELSAAGVVGRVRRGDAGMPRATVPCALFTAERVAPLLREILMEAWSIGRSTPSAASFLFGLAPSVSKEIAGLTAPDIDRVVIEHARHVGPALKRAGHFGGGCLRRRWAPTTRRLRTFTSIVISSWEASSHCIMANLPFRH